MLEGSRSRTLLLAAGSHLLYSRSVLAISRPAPRCGALRLKSGSAGLTFRYANFPRIASAALAPSADATDREQQGSLHNMPHSQRPDAN